MMLKLNKLFYSRATVLIAIDDFKNSGNEMQFDEDEKYFIIGANSEDSANEFSNYALSLMKSQSHL